LLVADPVIDVIVFENPETVQWFDVTVVGRADAPPEMFADP
jgi:hypothetical protein